MGMTPFHICDQNYPEVYPAGPNETKRSQTEPSEDKRLQHYATDVYMKGQVGP